LDVSQNTALTNLYCPYNQLTSLTVSGATALSDLVCRNNLLTNLDVSNNTNLLGLQCNNNQLTNLDIRNGNNNSYVFFTSTNNPNLYCIDVDDVAWADTNWTVANGNIDSTMSFSANCATAFGCLDPLACNYDSIATIYDSSCVYPVIWQQAFSICNGDSVIVGSSVYDTTGNYIDILTAGNGCDSSVYTNISLPLILQQALVLCAGDSLVVGGNVYNTAGNYIDTLNTVNGCDSIVYTNISIPAGMVITTNTSSNNGYNISCFGGNDGWITIDVTGGSPPYTYDWNIGLTGDSIYDLQADSYSVIITDVNNCIAQSTVILTDPNPFFANTSIANVSCYGYCDGSAVTTPIGGIAPYLINWSNGTITPYVSGLCPGLYSVTITDFDNCIANDTIMITEALPLISYDTLSVTATIVWNGLILFASGDYSANLITPSGCDSIANLNLTITNTTGILNITNTKRVLFKKTNVLGQETPYRRNTPLFYIYDDGTVEQQIVIE
ncbi:MAG: SprB repeat-containing protein, partial [Bacteroidota bacterium]|nr:SprB repeat-containing protein [Bacteroidota bacterium]